MQSCVVGISNTQFVVTGGGTGNWESYGHSVVYNAVDSTWTTWQDLKGRELSKVIYFGLQ